VIFSNQTLGGFLSLEKDNHTVDTENGESKSERTRKYSSKDTLEIKQLRVFHGDKLMF